MSGPLASVIVTSFNYRPYLAEAVDSALAQRYSPVEVIVVDDGSDDGSREVLEEYGDRIVSIFQDNRGQGASFNTGFARSRGEIVLFLDSDDTLLPQTLERVVPCFADPGVVKVHWPLWVVDAAGARTGSVKEPVLPDGDLRADVERFGPMTERVLPSAPTSGNAYTRGFLEQVMPVPAAYRISPDAYLFGLAPALGTLRASGAPLGQWRYHGRNASAGTTFEQKLANGLADYELQLATLLRLRPDLAAAATGWRAHAWWPRIADSLAELDDLLPAGAAFILADGDAWGAPDVVRGRRRFPLPAEGGNPSSYADAVQEVQRLRDCGAVAATFAWPVFWWFDYYAGLREWLGARLDCLLENDRLVVFELARP